MYGKILITLGDRPPRLARARRREAGLVVFMYFVYVLKSKLADKSYVGFTKDLNKRLREHNSGKSYYTKRYAPWAVTYTENYDSLQEALKREKYLKSASGRRLVLKKLF